nr:pentatricopeptide repeat-containing protein At3g09650, chloroplastic [Ipomoea batatas]
MNQPLTVLNLLQHSPHFDQPIASLSVGFHHRFASSTSTSAGRTPAFLTCAQSIVRRFRNDRQLHRLNANSFGLLTVATAKASQILYATSIIKSMLKSGYLPHVKAWSAVIRIFRRRATSFAAALPADERDGAVDVGDEISFELEVEILHFKREVELATTTTLPVSDNYEKSKEGKFGVL